MLIGVVLIVKVNWKRKEKHVPYNAISLNKVNSIQMTTFLKEL